MGEGKELVWVRRYIYTVEAGIAKQAATRYSDIVIVKIASRSRLTAAGCRLWRLAGPRRPGLELDNAGANVRGAHRNVIEDDH